ncbi:MAG TPA: hypothetical protein VFF93_08395 [Luteimonas sp.]|jgi:hypothetical protein|nr:hypothetical protein [Luteimonas sp.]
MRDHDAHGAVMIDIDAELSCWQQMESSATSELVFLFQEWEPAIRVGIHAYLAYPGRDFDSLEPTIIEAYQRIRGRSRIPWVRAAPAARRVWQKLHSDSEADFGSAQSASADARWIAYGRTMASVPRRRPLSNRAAPLVEA